MQFLVIGQDGEDNEAPERRAAARQAHIELGDKLVADGNMWYGAALQDEQGSMNGSMIMVDFPGRKELDAWLAKEPYVIGKVWQKIEVYPCKTRDPWQFNHPKEWFKQRQKTS